jgi:hypothetical protein
MGFKPGGVLNGGGSAIEWLADPGQIGRQLGGGKGNSSTPVGDAYAALSREQWYTYLNTFVPIENKLIEYATDPGVVDDGSFASAQAGSERRLRGMGVSLSGEEKAASDRNYGLAKSLADVGAQNTARDVTRQRQQAILGNPAPQSISI